MKKNERIQQSNHEDDSNTATQAVNHGESSCNLTLNANVTRADEDVLLEMPKQKDNGPRTSKDDESEDKPQARQVTRASHTKPRRAAIISGESFYSSERNVLM